MIKNFFTYWTQQAFYPDKVMREKVQAFQSLLKKDKRCHELMAELEEIYYDQTPVDFSAVEDRYTKFSQMVGALIAELSAISPGKHRNLESIHKKFDAYVRYLLTSEKVSTDPPYVLDLDDRQALDAALAGGKAANLARAAQTLQLPVPEGFVITTHAFNRLIEENGLEDLISCHLARLDIQSGSSLADVSTSICTAIREASVPQDVLDSINEAVARLQAAKGRALQLAIRSSAKGEDTQTTFAGQYKTVLNVKEADIVEAYTEVLASKYAPSAMVYRINYGLTDREASMAVVVVEMIAARASGVMFTGSSRAENDKRLSIHAVWGVGQTLVDGEAVPAVFETGKNDPPAILSKYSHHQLDELVLDAKRGLVSKPLDPIRKKQPPIQDPAVLELTQWGRILEDHFDSPQDVEWCLSPDGRLVLLQSRPYAPHVTQPETEKVECSFEAVDNEVLSSGGRTAAGGIAAGNTIKITQIDQLVDVPDGSVLVTRNIPPAFTSVVNRLHAVVAESGSTAGHFASVAREFGIPTVVQAAGALDDLPEGVPVTVDADNGVVYNGVVTPMVDSPCARRNLLIDSPFMNRLGAVMSFISPLVLTNPDDTNFIPEGCRSHHDIIRFVHEKAVAAMFHLSDIRFRKVRGAKKLSFGIPMVFYVIDVGGGLMDELSDPSDVVLSDISSAPLRALFKGLTHPDIQWGTFSHFDWASYDKAVMSGGHIRPDSVMVASHAIISTSYANLNLRFGYHFVILDTVCGDRRNEPYILLRFSGGGADIGKRRLRAFFLSNIFKRLGFDVQRKMDLIDARYSSVNQKDVEHALDMVGRLLGATRLMDMYLKDEAMVEQYVEEFMQGRYHFSSVDLES